MLNAVFILPPQVHLLDITGPAHIFYEAADYGAAVKLNFCTIFQHETKSVSSSALAFHQLTPYNELILAPGDFVFIPGLDKSLLLDDDFIHLCSHFPSMAKTAAPKWGVDLLGLYRRFFAGCCRITEWRGLYHTLEICRPFPA